MVQKTTRQLILIISFQGSLIQIMHNNNFLRSNMNVVEFGAGRGKIVKGCIKSVSTFFGDLNQII